MRQENLRRLISIASTLTLALIFSVTNSSFFSVGNLLTILRECAVTGILAVGVAIVIITAGIDLSTGAMLGFCGTGIIRDFGLCPLQRLDQLRQLRKHHPELWKRLRELDDRARAQFGDTPLGQFKTNWSVERLEERFALEESSAIN